MALTPEGRVKKAVIRVLESFGKELDDFWPVPSGYGQSHLDCIVCFRGMFIAIECKAPGKHPTSLQVLRINNVRKAGGIALVIDSEDKAELVRATLLLIKQSVPPPPQQEEYAVNVPRKRKTQGRGRARNPNTERAVL